LTTRPSIDEIPLVGHLLATDGATRRHRLSQRRIRRKMETMKTQAQVLLAALLLS
jgi:hypothetical protein